MSRVSIVRASGPPRDDEVRGLVERAIDLVGGIGSVVREGDVVALKPNVVTGDLAGPGVTTDNRIIEALIQLCYGAGARKVMVVEGSGYFTPTSKALELSGVKALAEDNGAEVVDVDEDELVDVEVPDPLLVERVLVSRAFMEADVRINLPVMKTHDQLVVTLGVKNLKGVMPKPEKRRFHRIGVVKGILDLSKAVPVDLTVLDALTAMEGLGPSFGDLVEMNTIMASRDVYSLDVAAVQAMGFRPGELDYLAEARDHGLVDFDAVEVVGEPISAVAREFKRPPMDINLVEGVAVISERACSACHGTIHSVLYDLEQMGRMGEVGDLSIVVGAHAEVPEGLEGTPVIMGICQARNQEKGCYVAACPPNNDKMLAAIREVCGFPD